MAFRREIDDVVKLVFGKQLVGQIAVAYIPLYKETTFVVYVAGDSPQISGVSQRIQNDQFDVIVFSQNVLDVIGSDEPGRSCYKVSFHNLFFYFRRKFRKVF